LKGILYGVGVGPGDYELMTLKVVRILNENKVIAVPRTKGETTVALDIIKNVIDIGKKEIVYIDFLMSKDKSDLNKNHKNSSEIIIKYLKAGENVVFITLGDISVYSTFQYINEFVKKEGFESKMIAGVPSFCAIGSALNISITDKNKPVHIIPAIYSDNKKYLDMEGTKIFMKSGKKAIELKNDIINAGLKENSYAVNNCTMENEKVFKDISEIDNELGYFTTFIVKDSE